MKTLIRMCVGLAIGLATLAGTMTVLPGTMTVALAHGEKAQEPFLRMRTIHWYDVKWDKKTMAVNDVLTFTGKFRISPRWMWPQATAIPTVAFLNVSHPGPVFHRIGSWVNGVNMANSTEFELGSNYEYKIFLKAREPGNWHVHSMINVLEAGAIIGPGSYVEVTGDHADFLNEVKTLTGETVNLDTYGFANNVFWHLVWGVFGAAWLVFWLVRPLFFSRYRMVQAGRGKELNSRFDKLVAVSVLIGAIVLTIVGYVQAEARWPITLPLQSARATVEPSPVKSNEVKVKLERAEYRVPGREMTMKLKVTNNSDEAVRLGEYTTATVRFVNAEVGTTNTEGYPDYLLAENGLTVSDNSPIQPGETRILDVRAQDAAWETERLSSLIFDPDSRFGGLLFFFGPDKKRHISDIGGVLVPIFAMAGQ